MTAWQDHAACTAHPADWWFPDPTTNQAGTQTALATAVCQQCPVRRDCAAWARANQVEHGIWGGLTETDRTPPRTQRQRGAAAEPAPCGTEAAYRRHQRHGETPCTACRTANSTARADREARRKAQAPPAPRPPTADPRCGTNAGYKRHRYRGEEPCWDCRAANTETKRQQRRVTTTGKAS